MTKFTQFVSGISGAAHSDNSPVTSQLDGSPTMADIYSFIKDEDLELFDDGDCCSSDVLEGLLSPPDLKCGGRNRLAESFDFDAYDSELPERGLLIKDDFDPLMTDIKMSDGPTLAELNMRGIKDEFEPLDVKPFDLPSFSMCDEDIFSKCMRKDTDVRNPSSQETPLLPSSSSSFAVNPVHFNLQSPSHLPPPSASSTIPDSFSPVRPSRVLPPASSASTATSSSVLQRRPRHDTESSVTGWHCQIVPHSPVDMEPQKIGTTIANAGNSALPVLKIRKRTFSEESEDKVKLDVVSRKVRRTRKDTEVSIGQSSRSGPYVSDNDISDAEDDDDDNYSTADAFSDDEEPSRPARSKGNRSGNSTNIDPQKRYFWLYNVQAKGPKGRTSSQVVGPSDPHVLYSFRDPALDDYAAHKGRRSSGSDIDANPRRLLSIGTELNRLGAVINRNGTGDEKALSAREKNKFASRICRLKRKAQHEANKIKLQGLECEHNQLMKVLSEINASLVERVQNLTTGTVNTDSKHPQPSLTAKLETLMKSHLTDMIAEHTDEYVKSVLDKTAAEPRQRSSRH